MSEASGTRLISFLQYIFRLSLTMTELNTRFEVNIRGLIDGAGPILTLGWVNTRETPESRTWNVQGPGCEPYVVIQDQRKVKGRRSIYDVSPDQPSCIHRGRHRLPIKRRPSRRLVRPRWSSHPNFGTSHWSGTCLFLFWVMIAASI